MAIVGLPCPMCGMTRAFIYLCKGNITKSLKFNPMLLPTLFAFIFYVYFKIKKKSFYGDTCLISFFSILFLVFALRLYFYFPNKEPYVVNKQSLFFLIYYFIRGL